MLLLGFLGPPVSQGDVLQSNTAMLMVMPHMPALARCARAPHSVYGRLASLVA